MKSHEFYAKYANLPLGQRDKLISNDFTNPALGMTPNDIYKEIKAIDNKTHNDLIRKDKLIQTFNNYLLIKKN